MGKAFVSTVINAPIERVWRTVGDFNGLPSWMAGLKASEIEGGKGEREIGAVRRITMIGTDAVLREKLLEISDEDYLIKYAVLEAPLPVGNVVTMMRLRPITDIFGTLGEWSTEFEAEPGKEAEGAFHMTRVFNAGWRQLKRTLGV
jgi:uncharacterized protein YndB with AHSA1/START domain